MHSLVELLMHDWAQKLFFALYCTEIFLELLGNSGKSV